MSSIENPNFLETLKNEAKHSQPGIRPKNTKFESYTGHTVINISDITLDQHQIRVLEKGLTCGPTPGPPAKSQIWLDSKDIGPHIPKLLKLILHSMSISFNDDHYLQTSGTAMGTSTAPNYANFFVVNFPWRISLLIHHYQFHRIYHMYQSVLSSN